MRSLAWRVRGIDDKGSAQIVGWINSSSDFIDDERRAFDGFFEHYE